MAPAEAQKWFIALCMGGAVAFFVWWVHATYRRLVTGAALPEERRRAISSFLLLVVAPFAHAMGRWLKRPIDRIEADCAATGRTSLLVFLRRKAATMLAGAGHPHDLTADEFMGLCVVARLGAVVLGLACYAMLATYYTTIPTILVAPLILVMALLPELVGLWVVPGMAILLASVAYYAVLLHYGSGSLSFVLVPFFLIGLLLPWIWLRDCERARKRSIRRDLPFALDLLTLAVEAGLDFTAALGRIIRRRPQAPLSQELGETLRQIQMGVTRAQALRELADRVMMEEIISVTSALIQADELGASLGPTLRIQADYFRVRRAQAAEKAAMEAPVKLLFPLICFFFPATFIVLFGPIFVRFVIGD
ncbi:MAG: type II secretion system F family protein [Candidatus Brocadiia bacterium]